MAKETKKKIDTTPKIGEACQRNEKSLQKNEGFILCGNLQYCSHCKFYSENSPFRNDTAKLTRI